MPSSTLYPSQQSNLLIGPFRSIPRVPAGWSPTRKCRPLGSFKFDNTSSQVLIN